MILYVCVYPQCMDCNTEKSLETSDNAVFESMSQTRSMSCDYVVCHKHHRRRRSVIFLSSRCYIVDPNPLACLKNEFIEDLIIFIP